MPGWELVFRREDSREFQFRGSRREYLVHLDVVTVCCPGDFDRGQVILRGGGIYRQLRMLRLGGNEVERIVLPRDELLKSSFLILEDRRVLLLAELLFLWKDETR